MKEFLRDHAVLVVEEKRFKEKLLKSNGGIWTPDQYYNRMLGRAKLTDAERKICTMALEEVRAELRQQISK